MMNHELINEVHGEINDTVIKHEVMEVLSDICNETCMVEANVTEANVTEANVGEANVGDVAEANDLTKLRVSELKIMCDERDFTGYKKLKKQQLIDLLSK